MSAAGSHRNLIKDFYLLLLKYSTICTHITTKRDVSSTKFIFLHKTAHTGVDIAYRGEGNNARYIEVHGISRCTVNRGAR